MQGLMQDVPLTLPHFFGRAEQLFFDKEIVTATGTGPERTTYGAWAERTRRLGGVLDDLGISEQGRVATFAWNTARHLELYFAAPCSGPGAAHAEHPPVPRAARLHRQPRRGRDHLRRPLPPRAALAAGRPARDGAPLRGDGRRQGRRAQPRRRPADPRLRGPARRRRSRRLRRRGRTARRIDVLHERHHGEPEGRRVQPPVDLPAHARRDGDRRPRGGRERPHPAGGPDVPRQRVGSRPRGGRLGCEPGHARARPVAPGAGQPHRGREGHHRRRCADDLDGCAARAEGSRHVVAARHPVRWLRRPARALGGLSPAGGAADPAGVGDDGDQPDRVGGPHQVHPRSGARRRGAGRAAHDRRPAVDLRRRPHRAPGEHRVAARGTARAPASCRSADRGSRPSTTTTSARRSPSPRTDGSRPATSPSSTATGTSASSIAPRTSSSPVASGSRPSISRTS